MAAALCAALALAVPVAALAEPPAERASWDEAFAHARADLLAGRFAAAATALDALAPTAPTPADAAVAHALADLATEWAARGFAFVHQKDLGETGLAERATNRRTTSELAELYIFSVLYGVGTGAWIDLLSEPDSLAAAILPALALGGAAAGGVAFADAHDALRYGGPQTIVIGEELGLAEGILWTAWNQAQARSADEWSEKTAATVVWGGTTAGIVAGSLVGNLHGTTPGRAAFVGAGAAWTAALAGLGTLAVTSDADAERDDHALLAAALGLNAGAIAGVLAAEPVSPTVGRVGFLHLGGISGMLLGGGLYLSIAGDGWSGRALAASAAGGIAAGLGTAWFLTRDMETDRPEAGPDVHAGVAPGPDGRPVAVLSGTF